jgi:hypothetical protein
VKEKAHHQFDEPLEETFIEKSADWGPQAQPVLKHGHIVLSKHPSRKRSADTLMCNGTNVAILPQSLINIVCLLNFWLETTCVLIMSSFRIEYQRDKMQTMLDHWYCLIPH